MAMIFIVNTAITIDITIIMLGPNHVLPTSGTSRYTGGLSVFTFLRIRTWMNITDQAAASTQSMIEDCVALAR